MAALTGVATGYHELDKILLGLQPSSLVIVGARPGMGKTSFALGVLAHVGIVPQRPALLFSLEMGHLELTRRACSPPRPRSMARACRPSIRSQDWAKLGAAVTKLSNAPIFIDDKPDVTVMDIRARARRLKKKTQGDLELVVVDYLQLMTGRSQEDGEPTERGGRDQPWAEDPGPRARSACAGPVQLSRNLESRTDKTPQALRTCASRMALGRTPMWCSSSYREAEYNDEVPINQANDALVDVAKHRNGPTGKANLLFLKQYARFENHQNM